MSVKYREGFVTLCKVNDVSFDIVHNLLAAMMAGVNLKSHKLKGRCELFVWIRVMYLSYKRVSMASYRRVMFQ
jgi:recombinational DNA repair protein (RecF pathway)